MANYCLDSNVIIDFLRDNENVSRHIAEARAAGNLLSICPIVYYEIVRGFKIANASKQLEKFMSLYQTLSNLPFDMKAAEKAVDIYAQLRKGQNIEDNDIYNCGDFDGQRLYARYGEQETFRARRGFELRELEGLK